jgi:hypothetical protein
MLEVVAFVSYYYHITKSWKHCCDRVSFHIKAFNALAKTKLSCKSGSCNHLFGDHIPVQLGTDSSAVGESDASSLAVPVSSCSASAVAPEFTILPNDADRWEELFVEAMGFSSDLL